MKITDFMLLVTGSNSLGKAARLLLSDAEGSLAVSAVLAPSFPPQTSKRELYRITAHCRRIHIETESITTLLSLDSALPNSNNSYCSLIRAVQ